MNKRNRIIQKLKLYCTTATFMIRCFDVNDHLRGDWMKIFKHWSHVCSNIQTIT